MPFSGRVVPPIDLYIGACDPRQETTVSSTAAAASRAVLSAFFVNRGVVVTTARWYNGGTVSGNVDAGIYDSTGVRLASTGATAQSGTNAMQSAALTASLTLLPGTKYYAAFVQDNGTGLAAQRQTAPNGALVLDRLVIVTVDSAYPLPTPVALTAGANGRDYCVYFA